MHPMHQTAASMLATAVAILIVLVEQTLKAARANHPAYLCAV